MNQKTLSFLVISIMGSLNAQAAPVTTKTPCDNSGTTCQKEVVRDDENKTIKVTFSDGQASSGYFPAPHDYSHTIINNTDLVTPYDKHSYIIAANAPSLITGDVNIENNGLMRAEGTSTIDFQWGKAYGKFNINNTKEISTSTTGWNEYAIILEGQQGSTDKGEFSINNSTVDSLIKAKNPIGLYDAKKVDINNKGKIESGSATTINLVNVASAEIQNEGTITAANTGVHYSKTPSINIINSGTIETKGVSAISVYKAQNEVDPTDTSALTLVNTGKIVALNNNLLSLFAGAAGKITTLNNNGNAIFAGAGDDNITSTDGEIIGKIYLGAGNDTATFTNTNLSKVAVLSGSNNNNPFEREETNTLNLNQSFTGSSTSVGEQDNTRIVNWNVVNIGIDAVSKLSLSGDLIANESNDSLGNMDIGSLGVLALAPNTKEATVSYNVVNTGAIDLFEGSEQDMPEATLTIKGNYEGRTGSKVLVKSLWNNPGEQKNDLLVIEGNATGQSEVLVVNQILGDVTADTAEKNGLFKAPVITVNGTDAGVFSGEAKTTNAGKAQLKREGNSYYWTLKANDEDIIADPVPGYVQQPYINRQMMLAQLGKLHERVGEQRYLSLKNAVAEKQLWVRTSYDFTTLQGKQRFGTDVQSGFIQVGKDLGFRLNQDNSQQHAGLMFTYGWAKSKFFDKFRAENGQVVSDKYTGKSHTDMLSVGGYHTYYGSNGFYVDTLAQLSWLQNRYNSIDNTKAKQNGVGVAASIEVGKSFPLLNPKLAIEPQTQFTYQRVWLNGFNDGTREVKKGSQDNISARLGARVIWNESLENNASQLYFTANLIQTLKGRDSNIQVGNQSVSERYGDLSAEFGIGGQYPINPNLSLYADVRYVIGMQDHSQTHKNSQLSRQSYNGRIGLRYSF